MPRPHRSPPGTIPPDCPDRCPTAIYCGPIHPLRPRWRGLGHPVVCAAGQSLQLVCRWVIVIGALAAIGGGALMALFGSNDTLNSGVQNVSTPTSALVSPAGSIQGASGAQTVFGSVRLRITATPTGAGHNLFLGIGPASAVDRYLSGVSYDVATNVSVTPFHLTLARHGGTATPPPPGSQSFWVAKASGNHPTLTWTVTSGSYRVVVMNTDASAPVAFAGGLDLTIPHSFAIGIGLLIGGIVLILIAIALIVLGVRTRARPQSQPVPDPAAGALARSGCTGRLDRTRGLGPGPRGPLRPEAK